MPFTMPNFQPLSPEQVSPLYGAISGLLRGVKEAPGLKKGITEAKYAPQTIQADIFGKEFAPLAAIATSPLAQAMIGKEGTNQLFQMISNLLQQNISTFGGQGGGQPGQGGSQSTFSQNNSGINPNISTNNDNMNGGVGGGQSQPSPLVPGAGQDIRSGATARVTAPYVGEQQPAGSTFGTTSGDSLTSSPTESTRTSQQTVLQGAKNAIPLLNQIASEGQPFLSYGGKIKLNESKTLGTLNQWGIPTDEIGKFIGNDKSLPSKYGKYRADVDKAPESLIKALDLPKDEESLKRLSSIVEPIPGEDPKFYSQRVISEALELKNQRIPTAQQTLREGYNLPVNGSSYDKNGNNTVGNPLEVIDRYNNKNTTPEAVSNQLKNNNVNLTYSEGKEPPPGFHWLSKDGGKHIIAVHESKMDEAKKRKYKEVA